MPKLNRRRRRQRTRLTEADYQALLRGRYFLDPDPGGGRTLAEPGDLRPDIDKAHEAWRDPRVRREVWERCERQPGAKDRPWAARMFDDDESEARE